MYKQSVAYAGLLALDLDYLFKVKYTFACLSKQTLELLLGTLENILKFSFCLNFIYRVNIDSQMQKEKNKNSF